MYSLHKQRAELGAVYWTVPAPDIFNPEREAQGSVSLQASSGVLRPKDR